MRINSFGLTFLGILLILCSCGLYYLAFGEYVTVQEEVFHEPPRFLGFFHGRSPGWYLLFNGPLIAGIILLIIAIKMWRRKARLISG